MGSATAVEPDRLVDGIRLIKQFSYIQTKSSKCLETIINQVSSIPVPPCWPRHSLHWGRNVLADPVAESLSVDDQDIEIKEIYMGAYQEKHIAPAKKRWLSEQ